MWDVTQTNFGWDVMISEQILNFIAKNNERGKKRVYKSLRSVM
jgi:hypothetical protein